VESSPGRSVSRVALFRLVPLAAAVALAGCEVHVGGEGQVVREERTFEVSGVPSVRLATYDGAVEIRSWDRPQVLVEIEKRGRSREAIDEIQIVQEQTGGTIHVEARRPRPQRWLGDRWSSSARLIASVPRRCDLMVRTGDGVITIERVTGRLELRTDDGAIRGTQLAGDIVATSGDGSLRLEDVDGRARLTTADGGVTLDGRLEAVRIHTSDGSIALRADEGSRLVEAWDIDTGDGAVVMYLPKDLAGELDAQTGEGSISSDLAVTVGPDEAGRLGARSARGRLGSGGPALRIRTADGSIQLRSR
jgi:hypothetical protein